MTIRIYCQIKRRERGFFFSNFDSKYLSEDGIMNQSNPFSRQSIKYTQLNVAFVSFSGKLDFVFFPSTRLQYKHTMNSDFSLKNWVFVLTQKNWVFVIIVFQLRCMFQTKKKKAPLHVLTIFSNFLTKKLKFLVL